MKKPKAIFVTPNTMLTGTLIVHLQAKLDVVVVHTIDECLLHCASFRPRVVVIQGNINKGVDDELARGPITVYRSIRKAKIASSVVLVAQNTSIANIMAAGLQEDTFCRVTSHDKMWGDEIATLVSEMARLAPC